MKQLDPHSLMFAHLEKVGKADTKKLIEQGGLKIRHGVLYTRTVLNLAAGQEARLFPQDKDYEVGVTNVDKAALNKHRNFLATGLRVAMRPADVANEGFTNTLIINADDAVATSPFQQRLAALRWCDLRLEVNNVTQLNIPVSELMQTLSYRETANGIAFAPTSNTLSDGYYYLNTPFFVPEETRLQAYIRSYFGLTDSSYFELILTGLETYQAS